MKGLSFIKKISWKIILVHLTASFFFILSAKYFSVLFDVRLFNLIDEYGVSEAIEYISENGDSSEASYRFGNIAFHEAISRFIGLIVAFFMSFWITIKKKGFWLNSVIVLLLSYILNGSEILNNVIVDFIPFSIGKLFAHFGLVFKLIFTGLVFLFLGFFVFWNRRLNLFVFRKTSENK